MTKRVLISGSGVAGPVTAYWLDRYGFDVTVQERSEELRLGGQNIDISDAARDVIERMDLRKTVLEHHTGEKGTRFIGLDGHVSGEFPVEETTALTREIEILRGDLVRILADACPDSVKFRFGDYIQALDDMGERVSVTFDSGKTEDYDIVLAADGMNSPTRKMIIGEGDYEDYLGCWSSYFTIPRLLRDTDWWNWYTAPTGIVAFLRPDNKGTIRACVNFLDDNPDPDHMSLEDKKAVLQKRLRGSGWECDRIADALDDVDDLYLGPLHQIKAGRWSSGRCGLVGDSAHCPTPYTGMGTTLAVIGAYILANELGTNDDHRQAFAAYERKFRTFAEESQKLWPGVPELAYAESRFKAHLINFGVGLAASTPVQTLMRLFEGDSDENKFELPAYQADAPVQ
jgi:2-polyprenyl-6-methoxyphenol hydroxylase-like FAD-dependent oxidoreductase